MAKDIHQVAEVAREELGKITGLQLSTTLGAVKEEKGWRVSTEVIEKHSIPDQLDILATYDVILDDDGKLIEFNRRSMRERIDTK
ncbi:MAG: gas vesicle protein [Candidatus Omnitrophica bacterium]|nr:gas vesicle protein [Candidatus Omnitrophota bacterium]